MYVTFPSNQNAMSRCQAKTESGDQCKNTAQEGSDYCWIESHGEDVTSDENTRNSDFQSNHKKIVAKYIELLKLHERAPTLQEVADETGFHINTVWRHVNDMDLSEHVEISGTKALTQDVLLGIAKAAKNGSASNAKLFMQIVHDWSEKQQLEHSGDLDLKGVNFE